MRAKSPLPEFRTQYGRVRILSRSRSRLTFDSVGAYQHLPYSNSINQSRSVRAHASRRSSKAMASMEVEEAQLGFPHWKPLRRRFGPESPFFASGNIERELLAKQIALDLTEDEKHQLRNLVDEEGRGVFCPIVGCGARLSSLEDFEDHYNARHTASCSVCFRVYPTSRLLSIHVAEAHDSFFQAKVARGYAMYECLVEGCDLKLKNYKSRQQHLVDKHKFPTSFEFFKKALPSKKQRQKNQRKQSIPKKPDSSSMEVDNEKQRQKSHRKQSIPKKADSSTMEVENETIDGLVSAVSKLSTSDSSPSSISFGRRPTRGLTFVPRAVQREKKPDST